MSKAILKFNLSDPEDMMEFKRMMKSADLASMIWDLMHNTRKEMEYLEDLGEFSTTKMWEKINELAEKNNIVIENLTY